MKSTWTIAPKGGAECGYDGARIPAGARIERLRSPGMSRDLIRCAEHAHTLPDEGAIADAIKAAELEQLRRDAEVIAVRQFKAARPVRGFKRLSEAAGATFDARMAAAGERE